ncbi:MAG: XTP/dITP diphosphatase [Thermoplasmata archaeon]|nr:XTP/dITP diphosphatase [Thermoplasmata archaeon]
MQVKVISTNSGKFAEISKFFEGLDVQLEMQKLELLEIQADTLEAVVSRKLASVEESVGNCLVDDSGLFIDALSGFPGVYSSYVYRTIGVNGICKLMRGVENRSAHFECLFGFRINGRDYFFKGECTGEITDNPRGSGGFGFDPIFVPEGYSQTFAELPIEEKNRISHRGRALQHLRKFLENLLEKS